MSEVAVVITNYNYGEYLEQAVQSALDQTYPAIRLYIIDDASTDNSKKILKKYADKAAVIQHVQNHGIVYTRNEALDIIKTPYILFLDADNWFEPQHVEKLVAAARQHDADVVYCGMQYYSEGVKGIKWLPPEFNVERLKNENYIDSSSLVKTSAISDTRFDPAMEKLTHEDWDFFLGLALQGSKITLSKDTFLNYRVKVNRRNITNTDADEKFAHLFKYLYEKYSAQYPLDFGYLAYYRFAKGYLSLNESLLATQGALEDSRVAAQGLLTQINSLQQSKSYRTGRLIALPIRMTKIILKKIHHSHPLDTAKRAIAQSRLAKSIADSNFSRRNKGADRERYFIKRDGKFERRSDLAVVLHLYYTENWKGIFLQKLQLLAKHADVDLYITMPIKNEDFVRTIRKDFKNANIFFVPNKGRDVLPFLKAAGYLESMGYKKVLKIHSKKSTHRDIEGNTAESGDSWLMTTLDALIPENTTKLKELLARLHDDNTGIIGAGEYCYPIKMYLDHNRELIERLLTPIDPTFFKGQIADKLDHISYFGGTMFWVDLQSIHELFITSKNNFQEEAGQTDGTTAHALERLFSMLPQIKHKQNYSISPDNGLRALPVNPAYPQWYYDDLPKGRPCVSIVVPVYSDWWSLEKNIHSLKKHFGGSEIVSIHYVNDCGPDAEEMEKKILTNIEGLTNFYYYSNPQNLGFVKTCNRAALELVSKKDDILLLNSDTKVTKNFVYEMRNILYSKVDIGAVTSRSNNATIWSVPMTSKLANYRWASYLLYRTIKHVLPAMYYTPTIHGFCVLIRREVINRYGMFDEVYGRGYGEENDFAMRIIVAGWRCAVANYSFVFHYESRSFGNEARNAQIEKNEKILLARYPNYRVLVQQYWDSIKEPLK